MRTSTKEHSFSMALYSGIEYATDYIISKKGTEG